MNQTSASSDPQAQFKEEAAKRAVQFVQSGMKKDRHLLDVCRYVVLNPARARMVERPEAWKWSSYDATAK